MHFKRRFYDLFSCFYDRFVRLHSRDRQETLRDFLAEVADVREGETVVDLCTGTGSSALRMARAGVRIIGIDFSEGMLRRAKRKSEPCPWIHWVQADARALPIRSGSVDRTTCAYAMYELPDVARRQLLGELNRILKPGGMFVMMEHLPPNQPLIRWLYLIRIHVLGSKGVGAFAGAEEDELGRSLEGVGSARSRGGGTKAVFGYRARPAGHLSGAERPNQSDR
jgi:demethylmenaquinone methyltransferase/2-methoxy-6-polyprenyl-1,4-benzoquinol methylase